MSIDPKFQGRDRTRELVRARDGYTCQKCNRRWKKGERSFHVHHKDKNSDKTKKYDRIEDMDNLVTLCHSCHFRTHGKDLPTKKHKFHPAQKTLRGSIVSLAEWAFKNHISVRQARRLVDSGRIPTKRMKIFIAGIDSSLKLKP